MHGLMKLGHWTSGGKVLRSGQIDYGGEMYRLQKLTQGIRQKEESRRHYFSDSNHWVLSFTRMGQMGSCPCDMGEGWTQGFIFEMSIKYPNKEIEYIVTYTKLGVNF